MVAPTCDGEDVGEAWVAFQWVRRLTELYDTTVLTYNKRGRTPLSRQLPGGHIVEWTEPPLLGRAERLNSMLKPGYGPFYLRARRWITRARVGGTGFDVAHQPVPVAMRYPSPLVDSGIPYVIGPVGGSLHTPPGFAEDGDTSPWYVQLRSLDQWRLRHEGPLRRTYENAACILGIAPYVADHLTGLAIRRFQVMSETALETLPAPVDRRDHEGPLRLLFVGRLIRTKGARDVIRAMSLVGAARVTLDVVGDGFDRSACAELVEELDLQSKVTFHGQLPRQRIDDFYRRADVFVFPSYREPGGNVVFEAMGYGLPLIVSDVGGPGTATDDSCAIRITPTDPETYAREIANAIVRLAGDAARRRAMGEAARRRAQQTASWDTKVAAIDSIYRSICRPSR